MRSAKMLISFQTPSIMIKLFLLIAVGLLDTKEASIEIVVKNGVIQTIIIDNAPPSLSCQLFLSKTSKNPILGEWQQVSNRLTFKPAVPLDASDTYYLKTNLDNYPWLTVETIRINRNGKKPVTVVGIYPSANELPENLLRFYVEFSQPMREDDFLSNVSFKDENGNDLSGIFLPSRYEYWNKERTMITLIFDPGRVKAGLRANQKMGRALQNGKKYQLVIESSCRALNGQKLDRKYSKEFVVTEEVNSVINPNEWIVTPPLANTKGSLILDFNRFIDHLNASTFIAVFDTNGHQISGTTELSNNASTWTFFPEKKWIKGKYKILVYNKLEDICGNNLIHGFDVIKASEIAQKNIQTTTELVFKINCDYKR